MVYLQASRPPAGSRWRCPRWAPARCPPWSARWRGCLSGGPDLDPRAYEKAAARGVVPDAVIDRPKGYFPVPALSDLAGPVLELWLLAHVG
jgi:hypothetical protein